METLSGQIVVHNFLGKDPNRERTVFANIWKPPFEFHFFLVSILQGNFLHKKKSNKYTGLNMVDGVLSDVQGFPMVVLETS